MEAGMTGRKWMVAIATLGALAAGASTAAAHTEKTPGDISVDWTGSAFSGSLESSDRCVKNRQVKLFERNTNGTISTTSTDDLGDWEITSLIRQNGDYYVKAPKRVLKRNDNHEHICKGAKSQRSDDALVRDCDEVTLYDGSGGDGSQNVDVDDDLVVFVEGREVFRDDDDFAGPIPPMSLGPVSFGEDIRIVATNSESFGFGPVSIDPLNVQCSATGGSGSAVLDSTGFTGEDDPGAVFYDETYAMPVITLTR